MEDTKSPEQGQATVAIASELEEVGHAIDELVDRFITLELVAEQAGIIEPRETPDGGAGGTPPDSPKGVAAARSTRFGDRLELSESEFARARENASPAPSLAALMLAVRIAFEVGDRKRTPEARAETIAVAALELEADPAAAGDAFELVTRELYRAQDTTIYPVDDVEHLAELAELTGEFLDGKRSGDFIAERRSKLATSIEWTGAFQAMRSTPIAGTTDRTLHHPVLELRPGTMGGTALWELLAAGVVGVELRHGIAEIEVNPSSWKQPRSGIGPTFESVVPIPIGSVVQVAFTVRSPEVRLGAVVRLREGVAELGEVAS